MNVANSSDRPDEAPSRPASKLIVFDFDGTLSWIRHGWPGMMCDVFLEHYPAAPGESTEQIREMLLDEIMALNGKPSIQQCARFVEIMAARGAAVPAAETLRAEFQRRLDEAIAQRIGSIREGASSAEDFLIHCASTFLAHLRNTGVTLAILSTTLQERLEEEAELLGIAQYFGRHIYGGTGDPLRFSKRAVFERLLREEGVEGWQLFAIGDGPVEIRDTKELGGVAIGVCSDEERNGSGVLDPRKRHLLFAAGADVVIPDYRDVTRLLDFVLGR